MMNLVFLSAMAAALIGAEAERGAAPAPAPTPAPTPGPATMSTGPAAAAPDDAATQSVAFKNDQYDRMTVGVMIAGSGPYRFMVDTGANRSAISRSLADRLGLQARAPRILHSAAGVSQVSTVRIPSLQFETRDEVNIDAPILEANDMGADGILGIDALRTQRIILDFKNQRVFLTPTVRRERRLEPGEIIVKGTLRQGHLVLTDATMFGDKVTIVVDTGAQMSIGNAALYRLLRRAGQVDSPLAFEQIAVTGVPLKGQLYTVSEVQLNDITMRGLNLMIADAQTFKVLGRTRTPTLLLGMNALRAFERVEIDLSSKRVRLKVGELPVFVRGQDVADSSERHAGGR